MAGGHIEGLSAAGCREEAEEGQGQGLSLPGSQQGPEPGETR